VTAPVGAGLQETMDGWLGWLLSQAEPGQVLHHLVVIRGARTPLGLPDPEKWEAHGYAVAPVGDRDPMDLIVKTVQRATRDAHPDLISFMGLAVEGYGVHDDGDEVTENLARRLRADGRLQDHPKQVEVTKLYAACRDGRRWSAERIVTGPRAGEVIGPAIRTAGLAGDEVSPEKRLIRAAVGMNQ
jgi:hypothetical protein